jgi:hypothetical protein
MYDKKIEKRLIHNSSMTFSDTVWNMQGSVYTYYKKLRYTGGPTKKVSFLNKGNGVGDTFWLNFIDLDAPAGSASDRRSGSFNLKTPKGE